MFTKFFLAYCPGILLCVVVSAAAAIFANLEIFLFGRAYLEPLVLAILVGATIRTLWEIPPVFEKGIGFCARFLLEVAVFLLGASLSFSMVAAAGWGLFAGIAIIVILALVAGYAWGRFLKLPHRMAILVACGNAICGNSAIAAVAPVIGAKAEEVAASIAFTAVLGVVLILFLPLAIPLLQMTQAQYGVLAGLTVYAVPQVLAATAPAGLLATQMGTLVKLLRVLMLGPLVIVLSFMFRAPEGTKNSLPLHRLFPWFIIGFLALMTLRSFRLLPPALFDPVFLATHVLTVLAMAGLGLGVDVRQLRSVGMRVVIAVCGSLLILAALSLVFIHILL